MGYGLGKIMGMKINMTPCEMSPHKGCELFFSILDKVDPKVTGETWRYTRMRIRPRIGYPKSSGEVHFTGITDRQHLVCVRRLRP